MRATIVLGLAALSICGLNNHTWAQEKGDRVVVIRSGAALEAPARDPQILEAGSILEVRGVRGNWLRVAEGDGGWIAKRDVTPLALAESTFRKSMMGETPDFDAFLGLAHLRGETVGWQEAVSVFDEAIKAMPNSAMAYFHRGMANAKLHKVDIAIKDYEKAIELDGNLTAAINNLAWIRATGEAPYRNGEAALQLASKAKEITKDRDGAVLDTFAAAKAEVGQFQDAVRWQMAAIKLTGRGSNSDALYERLKLYTSKQAFRAKAK